MTLVVDASVAVLWFFEDELSAAARRLVEGGEELIAPELILAETGSAFWKLQRNGRMDPADARLAARRMTTSLDRIVSLAPLVERALGIAAEIGHPICDCFYVALAEAERATMVTIDRRLLDRLRGGPYAQSAESLTRFGPQSRR